MKMTTRQHVPIFPPAWLLRTAYDARLTMHCQWGWLCSFSFLVPGDLDLPLTLTFELGRDLCTMYVTGKFRHHTFNRSENITRTKKQTHWQTNRRRWKHPPRFVTLCQWVKIKQKRSRLKLKSSADGSYLWHWVHYFQYLWSCELNSCAYWLNCDSQFSQLGQLSNSS